VNCSTRKRSFEIKKRVLINGAAGAVGRTLAEAWKDRYALTLCDIKMPDATCGAAHMADIRDYARMRQLSEGQDVLVHLAYLPQSQLGKHGDDEADIAGSIKTFEAAREGGAKKIIYASSNAATGQNEREPLRRFSSAETVKPDSWYGVFKAMAEMLGTWFAQRHEDMRFVGIRIGTHGYNFTIDSDPKTLRNCYSYITRRDLIQLFTLAVDYEGPVRSIITYGTSGNTDGVNPGFMDIRPAMDILGYRPEDNVYMAHRHKYLDTDGAS
jgi:uronate dehydrogenase